MEDKHFIDWYSHTFGYGYGDGELHIIPALKGFMATTPMEGNYDYREIENAIGKAPTWFLMNELCEQNFIEYGTSPRFGWLDKKGKLLKEYMTDKTAEKLYELVMVDSDYYHCDPDFCNCGPNGYSKEKICHNPLFTK